MTAKSWPEYEKMSDRELMVEFGRDFIDVTPNAGCSVVETTSFVALLSRLTNLREIIKQATVNLAALFADPDNPTFKEALAICSNPADAACILDALIGLLVAKSALAGGEKEE